MGPAVGVLIGNEAWERGTISYTPGVKLVECYLVRQNPIAFASLVQSCRISLNERRLDMQVRKRRRDFGYTVGFSTFTQTSTVKRRGLK